MLESPNCSLSTKGTIWPKTSWLNVSVPQGQMFLYCYILYFRTVEHSHTHMKIFLVDYKYIIIHFILGGLSSVTVCYKQIATVIIILRTGKLWSEDAMRLIKAYSFLYLHKFKSTYMYMCADLQHLIHTLFHYSIKSTGRPSIMIVISFSRFSPTCNFILISQTPVFRSCHIQSIKNTPSKFRVQWVNLLILKSPVCPNLPLFVLKTSHPLRFVTGQRNVRYCQGDTQRVDVY